jgi:hypothetical protein
MYVSFDDGATWRPLQLNLPVVPITDLAIKNDDLIAATQGRSFWVLDDLTPLRDVRPELAERKAHLYPARPVYRIGGGWGDSGGPAGENPPAGPVLHFVLNGYQESWDVSIQILQESGEEIRSYSTKAKKRQEKLEVKDGMNRFAWDMRYPAAKGFEGMVLWAARLDGPTAPPGKYRARLKVSAERDGVETEVPIEILPDPRAEARPEDYRAQFEFQIRIRDKLTEMHEAILRIRSVREQVDAIKKRVGDRKELKAVLEAGGALVEKLTAIEEALYQTKNRSGQDPLNYPIRLNNRLAALAGAARGNYPPTAQAEAVRREVTALIDGELA